MHLDEPEPKQDEHVPVEQGSFEELEAGGQVEEEEGGSEVVERELDKEPAEEVVQTFEEVLEEGGSGRGWGGRGRRGRFGRC